MNIFQYPDSMRFRLFQLLLFLLSSIFPGWGETPFCVMGESMYVYYDVNMFRIGGLWETKIYVLGNHFSSWPFLLIPLLLMILPFFRFSSELGGATRKTARIFLLISLGYIFLERVAAAHGHGFDLDLKTIGICIAILMNYHMWKSEIRKSVPLFRRYARLKR